MQENTRLNGLVNFMQLIESYVRQYPNDQELGNSIRRAFHYNDRLMPKWSVEVQDEKGPICVGLFESLPHAKLYRDTLIEIEEGLKVYKIYKLHHSGITEETI
jgi:hypothetical protein